MSIYQTDNHSLLQMKKKDFLKVYIFDEQIQILQENNMITHKHTHTREQTHTHID